VLEIEGEGRLATWWVSKRIGVDMFKVMLCFLSGCANWVEFDGPVPPDGLPRATPSAEDQARFQTASDWSLSHRGDALVIVRGGEVVFEEGDRGYDLETGHALWSGTKTFSCLLVQKAIANGDVSSLDERVSEFFPEILDPADPRRARITVRQLLDFTSGLPEDRQALSDDGLQVDQEILDKVAYATDLRLVADPGTRFIYGSEHLWVLAGWFQARTGQDPVDYLEEHVFEPVGFEYAGWMRDPAGQPALAYGAWTSAGQWAKIGMLLRDDGVFDGVEVLPPGAIEECTEGSKANPSYGLTMWLNNSSSGDGGRLFPGGLDDLFAATGSHDQRLYIIPSEDLVIARLGRGDARYADRELLDRAVNGGYPPGGGCDHTSVGAAWLGLALLPLLRRRTA
jgi:CubicO group peptidase (beta-lactamase class C family)